MPPSTHIVIGGTGGAGRAIVDELLDRGLPTRAVSRTARPVDGAESVAADLLDPARLAAALDDAAVVHMAAQPDYTRWTDEFPPMLEAVITAVGAAGAKLVMVDNLYAYGPLDGAAMTEETPQRATDTKGRVRAAMADRLLAAHASGEVRVAIGRASDYMGPGVRNSGVMALAFEPLRSPRGALRWAGRTDVEHSVAYLPDVARALVTLGLDDRADGRIWHLPHAPAVTGEALLAMINSTLPHARRTGRISPLMLRLAAPFHPISREMLQIAHQWTEPFVVDDSAFRSVFGGTATDLQTAVDRTAAASRSAAASTQLAEVTP